METDPDIRQVAKFLGEELTFSFSTNESQLTGQLSILINEMINKDFSRLVALLYRLDVEEKKLRQLLDQQPDANAGETIARLILQRQLQKIRSRRAFPRDNNIDEKEKW